MFGSIDTKNRPTLESDTEPGNRKTGGLAGAQIGMWFLDFFIKKKQNGMLMLRW